MKDEEEGGKMLGRTMNKWGLRRRGCWFVAVIIATFAAIIFAPPANAQDAALRGFDEFVEDVLRSFDVPGAAVAIVRDGEVLLQKGYGVRALGESAPVDETTRFGIASNTKAFTATALGMLVESGEISWDTPVVDVLPWFQLSDPYVTRELTILDLLVHRSGLGLGAGDLLFWPPSDYDRTEIARRLRYLPLETSFRSAYAYDNVLYLVAGEVIEAVSGKSWEEFVAEGLLGPVGMDESNARLSTADDEGNIAATHARIDGTVRRVAPFAADNTNPAGGINSNARDMARWMIVQLDSGRVATTGERIFTPRTTHMLWNPVTPVPFGNPPPGMEALRRSFNFYALGFGVRDYRGLKMVTHTGGLPGYVSMVALIPAEKIGVTVLTNQESGAAFSAIVYHALDALLGFEDTDWLKSYAALVSDAASSDAEQVRRIEANRDSTSGPSLATTRYAGRYEDVWYGGVTIEDGEGGLEIRFEKSPQLVGSLEHWQHDTFVARWYDRELRADAFVTFALNPDGSIAEAKMVPFLPSTDFSYDFQDLLLLPVRE